MFLLEQSAFAAWPALEEQDYSGWRVRFSNGYTKRANSANAITTSLDLPESLIEQIEAYYRSRSARPIFRLASFCTNKATDDALADRGYLFSDLSLVMSQRLDTKPAQSITELRRPAEWMSSPKAWIKAQQKLLNEAETDQEHHLQILQAIKSPHTFATLRHEGRPVCWGLGVIVDGQLGLFDIVTHPDFRGRGLATDLCHALLDWGRKNGASTAYLQVVASNTSAIGLYEKLGFRRSYHYWYRLAPE